MSQVWSKRGFNITSHIASVCHLHHLLHDAGSLSFVQCMPSLSHLSHSNSMYSHSSAPHTAFFLHFGLCLVTSVTRSYPSPSFLRISPWDEKQSLLLQGLGHMALQLIYTHLPSFAPAASPKSSFTPTLGSNQLYIKMIPKKSAAHIKAASGVHLCVFRPTQNLSTL